MPGARNGPRSGAKNGEAKRRSRDPKSTRADILEASCALFARDGPEAISLSAVSHLAGVNRGTAYQHFETREKLIEATADYRGYGRPGCPILIQANPDSSQS